jgi:hypothetical protein
MAGGDAGKEGGAVIAQPSLFDSPKAQLTAQQRFEEFCRRNPRVYSLICEHARRLKAAGRSRYSIKTIWAVMRWESDVRTFGERFKLDDRYYSRFARLVMQREPDLAGFFATRELRTK